MQDKWNFLVGEAIVGNGGNPVWLVTIIES